MVLKEKVVQYENGIKNIPLRRLFNLALKGGGLKGVTELAPFFVYNNYIFSFI